MRFLRRPEVESITGLSRSTIYARMAAKKFPKPVPLNDDADSGAVAWIEAEIIDW
jgi:prophage regulatory protein